MTAERTNLLTREGEVYLARKIEAGDHAARNEMIEANLPMVWSIAKRYRNKGLEMEDLIQEGTLGLHRATQSFDWRLGFLFATHAKWWVMKAIIQAVRRNYGPLRVPREHDRYSTTVRSKSQLTTELGRIPSPEELATHLEVTEEQLSSILASRHRVESTVSLDSSGVDTSLSERMADPNDEDPHRALERKDAIRLVDELLATLEPREERVIRMRYGIGGHDELELKEIAIPDGVTHQFISWVEQRALKRLREALQ